MKTRDPCRNVAIVMANQRANHGLSVPVTSVAPSRSTLLVRARAVIVFGHGGRGSGSGTGAPVARGMLFELLHARLQRSGEE